VTDDDLCLKHPRLFHMADVDAWPSIQRHGLLSTQALLALYGVPVALQTPLLTRRRATSFKLDNKALGIVVIRDQIPLSEKKLADALEDGITTQDWLRGLNSKVFFWVDPRRLERLRDAGAYRGYRQLVITVDTRKLVVAHRGRIVVADRNTGATSPFAHKRGRGTFLPLAENGKRRIVELVIEYGVPDIGDYVVTATKVGGGSADEVVHAAHR
jgi:hypothetical protein